jgi:Aspartyl protease
MRGLIFTTLISLFSSMAISQSNVFFTSNLFIKKEINSKLKDSKGTTVAETRDRIPFELEGGLIFVEATLGGKTKNYILDSGAPTLIINSKQYSTKNSETFVAGVSGHIAVETKIVKDFNLGTIKSKSLKAYILDISHLEKIKKRSIEGLIGMEHFCKSEILIDYEKKEILFLPKKRGNKIEGFEMVKEIYFGSKNHMPVVKLKIGKRIYTFGIDSGAEVNLLSKEFRKKILKENFQITESRGITGIENKIEKVESVIINKATLNKKAFYDMEFVFANMKHLNESYATELDGLLGYPFLSAAIFSINYRKNKLCIWEKSIREEIEILNPEDISTYVKADKEKKCVSRINH